MNIQQGTYARPEDRGLVPCLAPPPSPPQAALLTVAPEAGLPDLEALVEAIRAQDKAALRRLYDATAPRVYAVALRIVRNAASAEEVALDVYVQVWREAARFDPARASALSWMLMICRSRALDALRKRDEPVEFTDEHAAVDTPWEDPLAHVGRLEAERAIRRGLEALTGVERQLVALAFFRGLTHVEMALQAALPLGTVKSHMRRALLKMRAMMEDQGA